MFHPPGVVYFGCYTSNQELWQNPHWRCDGMPDEQCIHHWMIETTDSGKSVGRCRKCGAETEFPVRPWEDENFDRPLKKGLHLHRKTAQNPA